MAGKKIRKDEEKSFFMPDGKPKARTGFRGWILMRSNIDLCLRIVPGAFTKQAGKLKEYPALLCWPEMDDYDGACAFISAVMDKDVAKMEFFRDQFPEYNLGITEYLAAIVESRNAKFPGGTRLIRSASLPRGMRLDMEVSTDGDRVQYLRQVIRRGNREIAAKILATKSPAPRSHQKANA